MIASRPCLFGLVIALLVGCAQTPEAYVQEQDERYQPRLATPQHAPGLGPLVRIDAAHHNYHTVNGRYAPLARLLRADGCRVQSLDEVSEAAFSGMDVLLIANPEAPPSGVTFTPAEVLRVVEFVASGGGLLLVTDHPPYPANVKELAAAFNVALTNAVAVDHNADRRIIPAPNVFRRDDGQIGEHPIMRGRNSNEAIGQLASFVGTAFPVGKAGVSLFHFGHNAGVVSLLPGATPSEQSAPGWSQGAALTHGQGRVVILGEAGMLTVQRPGPRGLLAGEARDNQQFALNVVRWLSHEL